MKRTFLFFSFILMSFLAYSEGIGATEEVEVGVGAVVVEAKEFEVEVIETEEKSISVFGEIESTLEFFVENDDGLKYEGFENEIDAIIGLEYRANDFIKLGGYLENYTLLETPEDGESVLNEEELAAGFFWGVDSFDPIQFEMFTSLRFNIRGNDAFRFGPGIGLALSGEIEEAFIEYSLCNTTRILSGFGKSDFLLANRFIWEFEFAFLDFVKEDLGLALILEGELQAEDYFADKERVDFSYENEFFAGFAYSPVDVLEMNLCFAMFNEKNEDEEVLGLGMRLGLAFFTDNFGVELNYIPIIKNFTNNIAEDASHSVQLVLGLNL